jgi:DNA-binding MarR family transcriptional regulator
MLSNNREEEIFTLIHQVFRSIIKSCWSCHPETDLSLSKRQVLHAIDGGRKTMTEISGELNVAQPTTTVIVNKLVSANLVTRKHSAKDRRVIEIIITPKGKKLLATNEEMRSKQMKIIMKMLSLEDKETLLRILKKIAAKLP